ncbi:putative acyl-CoA N-acyltransferase [Haemophilus haemolyticus M19107]|nr:putative acyl-CoA N-acyltransferase [Haemophilus haemolyticus M19107]
MATNSAALIMSIISQIEASDFDRLYEIEQQAHLVPWSFGTLKNNQGERYLNLKLIENNQIIGFAICQTVLNEATLFNIAIVPSHQGNGLGKLLLNELIARLKKKVFRPYG